MNNVIRIHQFKSTKDFVPRECRPKIKFKGGLWRVEKAQRSAAMIGWREEVYCANLEATMFAIYLNQFLPGGCFGEKEPTTKTP